MEKSGSKPRKYAGLALTPPRGWNSWNKFAHEVNEKVVRGAAEALVSTGMRDAGYVYVVIDDCWHGVRDERGFIQADPVKFPSGMKALADHIHSLGLKFGIYSDAGEATCGGRSGSRGYEFQDALVYASWDVDYLKYDWCNTEGLSAQGAYTTMRDALCKAGRPVVFSLCEWGKSKPWLWAADVGHLWRTTGDITNRFEGEQDMGNWSKWGVMTIVDMQKDLRKYAGPDHWNDPDMLEVGNGMTENEDRAHFSMWCMVAAPLMAGNDLAGMSPATKSILMNAEVIAIDQDRRGMQGYLHSKKGKLETWVKPLEGDDLAVCFLNRGTQPVKLAHRWNPIDDKFSGMKFRPSASSVYGVRDLWLKKDIGTTGTPLAAVIPGLDVLMVRLSKR